MLCPTGFVFVKIKLNYRLIARFGSLKRKLLTRLYEAAVRYGEPIRPLGGHLPRAVSRFVLADFHLPVSADFLIEKIHPRRRAVGRGHANLGMDNRGF